MHPPPIYPQLPHLHDLGLAILACITPFWNMHPPLIFTLNQSIPFHLKRSFWWSDFSPLITSKPPSPQEMEHREKWERERVRKGIKNRERKALGISSNKMGSQYFERRKRLQLRKPFLYDSFFSPSIIQFWKLFPNHWESFCNSFLGHPLA
jgi:hypothetical protein